MVSLSRCELVEGGRWTLWKEARQLAVVHHCYAPRRSYNDSTSTQLPLPFSQHKLDGVEDRRRDGNAVAPIVGQAIRVALADRSCHDNDDDYGTCDCNRALATKLWRTLKLTNRDKKCDKFDEASSVTVGSRSPPIFGTGAVIFFDSGGSLGIGQLGLGLE
ncbi:hypothetical protein TIFTF001_032002 [Ficus carica]|uniref:Uncharacterized protein n=1 Tax=Ficus carica TaxID=3494 RepID=A0AA88DW13_FICCA|nr:hypothetical protein TIFTF001_031957 [Ficus carica]GMN62919.1 hypothetical protein TIFTF001_032002 [Ficus carica]